MTKENKDSLTQKKIASSPVPVKKETSALSSPLKIQPNMTATVPANSKAAKGQGGRKNPIIASGQKTTHDTQKAPGSEKPTATSQTGLKQSPNKTSQQKLDSLFSFGSAKGESEKPKDSLTGKIFGFGSSIFNSEPSNVQDKPQSTPPVSPLMQPKKETTKTLGEMSKQDKKQPQQAGTSPARKTQGKEGTASTENPDDPVRRQPSCSICKIQLNICSTDVSTCTECKRTVCNTCGFNPTPNGKEVR